MSRYSVVLFDIGGVLLTNGWDRHERAEVFARFGIDATDYEARQRDLYVLWDTGRITAREFLNATVFYKPRPFTREEYWSAILEQTRLLPNGAMGILAELAASRKYLLGALNNEPRETNEYRFAHFELSRYLRLRLSSCYLGLHKPDLAYYRRALDILDCPAERVLFIDDRAENVEAACTVGIDAILFEDETKLRAKLVELQVL